jgi:hypothetical protein
VGERGADQREREADLRERKKQRRERLLGCEFPLFFIIK